MQINDNDRQGMQKSFRNLTLFTSKLAKVEVEDVPSEVTGPAIYACNHRSLSDLLIAGPTFLHWGQPIRALVAASYFEHPFIGPLLRYLKCIPVQGTEAIEEATEALHSGWSVAIMPEGRVVPRIEWIEEGVSRGHIGVGKLASQTGFPVVVSGASGSELLWPRGKYFPFMRPWNRQKVVLRCEYLGVVDGILPRDATDLIMEGVKRCVERAERETGFVR
jgi:1-acyl-sn-glycerol-3-phosphate acyltransferase